MYEIRLNDKAKEDLFRIYEYGVSRFGVKQADIYFAMIHDCFDKIASNPYLFPEAYKFRMGYRYCVSGSDTIYYRLNYNVVEIMAIIGRQKY
jgi:toxin ParE1/3/4